MLLELPREEILRLLNDKSALNAKIHEGVELLNEPANNMP